MLHSSLFQRSVSRIGRGNCFAIAARLEKKLLSIRQYSSLPHAGLRMKARAFTTLRLSERRYQGIPIIPTRRMECPSLSPLANIHLHQRPLDLHRTNLCWNLTHTRSHVAPTRHYSSGPIRGQKNDGKDNRRSYPNVGPIPLAVTGILMVGTSIYFGLPHMKQSRSTYDDNDLEELEDHMANVWRDILAEEHGTLASGGNLTETVTKFVQSVLSTQEIADTVADLLARVMESKRFQDAAQKLIMSLWSDLLADPETLLGIIKLLQKALEDERVQESVQKLVLSLIQDKQVYEELTRLLVSLGKEQRVLEATQDLLTESAHNALNDKDILSHSMEFATKLVGDESIQRTTGEALRNTVTYAVKPGLSSFLYAMGVGLILIGIMALVNSRASEHEMEIMDRAMTAVGGNMHSAAKEGVAFPFRFVQRAAQKLLQRMAHAGVALVTAISTALARGLRVPVDMAMMATNTVSRFISAVCGRIMIALSESLMGHAAKKTWVSLTGVVTAAGGGMSLLVSWLTELSHGSTTFVARCSSVAWQSTVGTLYPLWISLSNVFDFLPTVVSTIVSTSRKAVTFFSNAPGRASDALSSGTSSLAALVNSASKTAVVLMTSSIVSGYSYGIEEISNSASKFVFLMSSCSKDMGATVEATSLAASMNASKLTYAVSVSVAELSSWFISLLRRHGYSGSSSTL